MDRMMADENFIPAHSFPKPCLKVVDHGLPFDGAVRLSRIGENGKSNDGVFFSVLACLRGTIMFDSRSGFL
jgi:hypothetical protein